jgi:hypothetical protein
LFLCAEDGFRLKYRRRSTAGSGYSPTKESWRLASKSG